MYPTEEKAQFALSEFDAGKRLLLLEHEEPVVRLLEKEMLEEGIEVDVEVDWLSK